MNTTRLHNARIIWTTKQDEVGGTAPTIQAVAAAPGFGKRGLIVPKLQHGTLRSVVTSRTKPARPLVDAVMTQDANCALGMHLADCLPIICYDPKTKALAMVHGGWKSLLQNILPLTIQEMQLLFGTQPKDLQVWIGPSLRVCCNKLQHTQVHKWFADWQKYLVEGKAGVHLDLQRAVVDQCRAFGIPKTQIIDSGICTYHEQEYYSHRRNEKLSKSEINTPQMSVIVWMEQ